MDMMRQGWAGEVRSSLVPTLTRGRALLSTRDVRDRLPLALTPFRNGEAAFTLATFIARYHSNPDRELGAFAIDCRAREC